jgi:hypothetical protein
MRVHQFLLENLNDERIRYYLRERLMNEDFRADFTLKYTQDTRLRNFLLENLEEPRMRKFLQSYGELFGITT